MGTKMNLDYITWKSKMVNALAVEYFGLSRWLLQMGHLFHARGTDKNLGFTTWARENCDLGIINWKVFDFI